MRGTERLRAPSNAKDLLPRPVLCYWGDSAGNCHKIMNRHNAFVNTE